jgi:large subunit ribosomal protein L20
MWGRKSKIKLAQTAATKAGAHAYRDRRNKKRVMRRLWQIRINAAARLNGLSYSNLMDLLKKANVAIDRKVLSQIAAKHPGTFTKIVEAVKK